MIARLYRFLQRRIAEKRPPDMCIGGEESPYLERWFVIPRNRVLNVYLHRFRRSDDDRALHDHPWQNLSILLHGAYVEHTIRAGGVNVRRLRQAGAMVLRGARTAHRVELLGGESAPFECWTLFITGPRLREWGFHCPAGWVHWRIFTNPEDGGRTIGRGCGDGEPGARG